ncbi:hypothetical protein BX600DRAFT_189589 [Xylariales sp. PMI_506]|nr:hypothetical protein BX600DRAFT_189589 [Xylariales sp. PMI_506]
MSQHALQPGPRRSESPSDSQLSKPPGSGTQDSPTIGKALYMSFLDTSDDADSIVTTTLSPPPISISTSGLKPLRKPAPSPLHASVAVSPPSSASPYRTGFPSPTHAAFPGSSTPRSPRELFGSPLALDESLKYSLASSRLTSKDAAPSPPITPITPSIRTPDYKSILIPTTPNDTRNTPDSILRTKPSLGSPVSNSPAMATDTGSVQADLVNGSSKAASLGSGTSSIPSKDTQDTVAGAAEVANLIKAAGSPEAVIQYLLKEKQSQAQQNTQLWRLVDKQRAMILGLNKDLERALKDKDRYRKKMKEVVAAAQEAPARPEVTVTIPRVDVNGPKEQSIEVPTSPSVPDSESLKNSPIDLAMAPYPITPPADHVSNGPPSAVGELLDPLHSMPRPSEHALDSFDREEEDRMAEEVKKAAEVRKEQLPYSVGLPPSRSLPSEPPRMPPPPRPPVSRETTPLLDSSISQFPPPSAPPPRKPPPAPLQLRKEAKAAPIMPPDDENESDSDYDSLLDVTELPILDKRGRRRTREEDDEARDIIAQEEAEKRSLSKKSKKGSQKGTPKEAEFGPQADPIPASPRNFGPSPTMKRDNAPSSLLGVLNSTEPQTVLAPPLPSPGLPASPRPMGLKSVGSPPLSPRGIGMPSGPLSPRAPRQPIPLPPNTPLTSPPPGDPLVLTSPKPLNITKRAMEPAQPSPTGSRLSPTERTRIFKGFVTEEFPDLLLPPNALPSIAVKVASSRMKPSRASLISLTQLEEDPVFTLAITARSEGGELWRIEKDTISLAKLDQKLKQCPNFTAKAPDRSLFNGHAPAKLDARRVALNQYWEELLNTPLDMGTAIELCKYLSTNTLPPNSDDTGSVAEINTEHGALKTGAGGRPLKSGYLTKRGKNFGGWKARFFVLDGPLLKYYETPGGAHLGTIKLQNAQIGKQSQASHDGSAAPGANSDELDNQYRHAFLVLEPKKKDSSSHVKHVLCAESDRERDQWVDTLLRWIDYRESEDETAHADSKHDRHGSGGSNQTNGTHVKKKAHGNSAKSNAARGQSQEDLIGISYEGTRQGDTPDGAPPRRRNTGTPEPQPERPQTAKVISGPRDPQIISDSSSWGTRAALAPPGPTLEEKKQRKRSFFGFGPKTRSSSDDQDSLFGGSGSTPPPGGDYRGNNARQVFGAPLGEAVRYHGPVGVNVPLPSVVYRCIQYLDAKNAILEEGIFRLSGSNLVIKQLRERFNTEGDVNLLTDETYYDIHAVASLLKLYLRELPITILTRDLHQKFVDVTEMTNHSDKIAALSELVVHLPQANDTLLRYLIAFLIKIINNAEFNKMTVRNVGIVFSPTLNIPAPVFALLLQNYEGIFGIPPEEYELPNGLSKGDSRSSPESQPRRPSTGTGVAASPHRQRLVEQLQQSRSSPTPPLMMSGGPRVAPTPPPGASRQVGYEPQYITHHQGGSQISLRPAYENGLSVPAYDRPHYHQNHYEHDQGDTGYDQSHAARAKRRESSMFMGNMVGLNSQTSRSRLREENHI